MVDKKNSKTHSEIKINWIFELSDSPVRKRTNINDIYKVFTIEPLPLPSLPSPPQPNHADRLDPADHQPTPLTVSRRLLNRIFTSLYPAFLARIHPDTPQCENLNCTV